MVYVILSALRVASAREIHEQPKIPRGRIYETLAQKGFIVSSGKSPARYPPVDVTVMFKRLKHKSVKSLEGLCEGLTIRETEAPALLMSGYKLYITGSGMTRYGRCCAGRNQRLSFSSMRMHFSPSIAVIFPVQQNGFLCILLSEEKNLQSSS